MAKGVAGSPFPAFLPAADAEFHAMGKVTLLNSKTVGQLIYSAAWVLKKYLKRNEPHNRKTLTITIVAPAGRFRAKEMNTPATRERSEEIDAMMIAFLNPRAF
jgi:hypothetical protein